MAKVTEDQVLYAYDMFRNGLCNDCVAKELDLHTRYVSLFLDTVSVGNIFSKKSFQVLISGSACVVLQRLSKTHSNVEVSRVGSKLMTLEKQGTSYEVVI